MPTTTNRLSPSAPKKLQVTLLALRTSDGAPEMIQTRPPAVYSEIEMSTIEAIAESMALRLKQIAESMAHAIPVYEMDMAAAPRWWMAAAPRWWNFVKNLRADLLSATV